MLSKFLKIWQPKEDDPKKPGKEQLGEKINLTVKTLTDKEIMELSRAKKADLSTSEPDRQEADRQEFINAYKDPRAINRLRWFLGGRDETDKEVKEGLDRVKSAKVNTFINNAPVKYDFSGRYNVPYNTIDLVDSKDRDGNNTTTLTHEFSHAFYGNSGNNKGYQDYIDNSLSQVRSDNWGFDREHYNYLSSQEEVRARLNELRSVRDPNNYWKEWTIDDLNDDKHYIPALDDLQQIMDDEQIVKLLNELATNEENKMRRFINLG